MVEAGPGEQEELEELVVAGEVPVVDHLEGCLPQAEQSTGLPWP